jgi:MFS family permease
MSSIKRERIDDSTYALIVAAASLLMLFVANGAMFMLVVAMKDISETFDWPRSVPSTAYSLQFIGGGLGGIVMGWWLDRAGMGKPALLGALTIGSGAVLVSQVSTPFELWAIYGILIGLVGNATMFSPIVTNITRWFGRNRGMAVGIVTSGQSLAGFLWPLIFEISIGRYGWRETYLLYGLFALVTMVPLALVLRRRPPPPVAAAAIHSQAGIESDAPVLHLRPVTLLSLLCAAIVGCCIAMSLPIAHLKSHASDIGIAPLQAASVLSVLLAGSFVARAAVSGLLMARIGALRTLFFFSVIQMLTLGLLPFVEGLWALYVVAGLFGFGYGGIGPTYPVVVREFLPEQRAGRYTATVIMFGTFGMAIGGWLGGFGFDLTGGYQSAFLVGVGFNLVNLAIVGFLIGATRRPRLTSVTA